MANPLAGLKKKPDEPEDDTPPGMEGTYVRGPLAVQTPAPKPTPDPKKKAY